MQQVELEDFFLVGQGPVEDHHAEAGEVRDIRQKVFSKDGRSSRGSTKG